MFDRSRHFEREVYARDGWRLNDYDREASLSRMKFCPYCSHDLVRSEIGGSTRLVCGSDDCDYVFWNNPVPVVAAIVERSDGVILVRNKGWPEKWLGLVTGFLERNEEPEAAILRELAEELGLAGEIVELVGIYTFSQMNQLILVYHVKVEGSVSLGSELESYKVIPIDRLKPWPVGTGPAVRDWLARR